jgi:hypothetical protein
MARDKTSLYILLACILLCFAACAPKKTPSASNAPEIVSREYKVSVTSDGKPIHSEELLHRIELRQSTVALILAAWPKKLNLPFEGVAERDNRGQVRGVRLTRKSGFNLPTLGLQSGDLITAVEHSPASDLRDLYLLFEALKKNGMASCTFERSGKPHKALYYLGS